MQLDEAVAVARNSRWLAQHDRRTQDLICSRMRLVNLPKGRTLFDIEDRARDVYCLVSGCAVITIPHPVQGVINGHVMFAGRWFGEPAALGKRPRMMTVFARRPTEFLALTQTSVAELLLAEPALNWVFFNLMAWNVEEYLLHAVDLLIVDPRLRLCSRLLTFGGRLLHYVPPEPVSIPLTQEELAAASNMSRSTVYHLLGELVEQGICELGYREVRILDMKRLAAIVDAAPAV
ncbi:Crp/Fnr family transcriptional regulator [Aestuariivirga sp.]|uniref:Crp/Fnr family transcriptional regulator n=1 Tax=Aestuariivirga sp. TaxID=2650926 RepID=UPI003BAAE76B